MSRPRIAPSVGLGGGRLSCALAAVMPKSSTIEDRKKRKKAIFM
jgi:hypothetical protein